MKRLQRFRTVVPNNVEKRALTGVLDMVSKEDTIEKGRIVSKAVIKPYDSVENFKGVKCSDFYLENLIATGALEGMSVCNVSLDRLTDADRMNEFFENNMINND